jgi:outer membrane protein assembly factor BamB
MRRSVRLDASARTRFVWALGASAAMAACSRTELDLDLGATAGSQCAWTPGDPDAACTSSPPAADDASTDARRGDDGGADGEADASHPNDASSDATNPPPAIASTYLIDPAHTGAPGHVGLAAPLARAWTAKLGAPVSYPLVASGAVYVTTNGIEAGGTQAVSPRLLAFDASTGATLWTADLGPASSASIAYDQGRIFSIDNQSSSYPVNLHAYDAATGAPEWTAQPDNQFYFDAPPVAYRGIVYVYGEESGGTVYAYDETTGSLLWRHLTEGGEGSPAISDDGVFISEGCHQVYAFDRVSGAPLWRHTGPCTGGGGATPLLYGHSLYVRDTLGDLVLDTATGSATAAAFASDLAPALHGTRLFSVTRGVLSAGDATQGGTTWTFTGDGRLATSPLVADGFVYVGSSTGNLFAVREGDGAVAWSENTGVPLVSKEEFGTEPRVAFAAGGGLLFVPVGSTLVAYASAAPLDGGAGDGGCTFGMTPVTPAPTTGETPGSLAIGDLDRDGHLDFALANSYIDSAGVMFGHGDGTFGPETLYPTDPGSGSDSVALGDFDGDGNLDVVTANPYSGYYGPFTVSVLLGRGDGTLRPRTDYATGKFPGAVRVGDLNGDARVDLVVVTEGLSVLLGNGDGTFQPSVAYTVGVGAGALALGDLNGDGKVDVAVTDVSDDSVTTLLGLGDGTLQAAVTHAVGRGPSSVAIGDVNGDGKADLAVTNAGDATVSILVGGGDGAFQPQAAFATGLSPSSVGIADLNRDGHADLAVTNGQASTVSILLGNGDGTFQPQFVYGTGAAPGSVATVDLNGDGWLDLAVADTNDNTVSVFLGGCRE